MKCPLCNSDALVLEGYCTVCAHVWNFEDDYTALREAADALAEASREYNDITSEGIGAWEISLYYDDIEKAEKKLTDALAHYQEVVVPGGCR